MWREKIKSILSWQKGREAKGRAEKKEFPELRGKQDKKELFQKAILQESRKAIQNPGCGWYHLYTFNAAQTGEPLYIACEEEELVLLRIDIGAFRDKPISEPSLEWIRRILAFFREKRKGMILRFSYDLEGKGLEKEPGSIRLVEEHMQQIGEVIREYADDIFAVQGILIGNWGEMHGSRYLTPDAFRDPPLLLGPRRKEPVLPHFPIWPRRRKIFRTFRFSAIPVLLPGCRFSVPVFPVTVCHTFQDPFPIRISHR